MATSMDGQEDDVDEDFHVLKRTKISPIFEASSHTRHRDNLKPKRGLSLSLKSTRSAKNGANIKPFLKRRQFLENGFGILDEKEHLRFCPVCQLPFVGLTSQSVESHVQECVTSFSQSSELCPNGLNCTSRLPSHYKQCSHQELASLRSLKANHISLDATVCTKTSSVNNANVTESTEPPLPSLENILDRGDSLENGTQSSEKENSEYDVNQGLCLKLTKDVEMNDVEFTPTQNCTYFPDINDPNGNNETINRTSATATSVPETPSNIARHVLIKPSIVPNTEGKSQKEFACDNFPKSLAQDTKTCRKQTDIGMYFGLKPKSDKTRNKTGNISDKMPLQKELSETQTAALCSDMKSTRQTKKCPFYKIVEGTSFAVDAFSYGLIPGISAYFLSHFHYDHYGGLKRSFSKPIYCSQITANLVLLKIKVAACLIHPLSLHTPTVIKNVEVTLLEANHCPGAVIFLFKLPNGQTHLHTGDFRASKAMEENIFLNHSSIQTLYLDTTYCDPRYSFPPQSETVEYCVSVAIEAVKRNTKTLIVVGTYTIGKEKIFVAVANALQCKVAVQRDKYNVLQCLESDDLNKIITQNYKEAQVHVLPMAHLNCQKLTAHQAIHSSEYSELLAFKPTGWTFTGGCKSDLKNIKPVKEGPVTIYGVPYSEHSSYNELRQFVQHVKAKKIIPTVNNGSPRRRDEMKAIFKSWLKY